MSIISLEDRKRFTAKALAFFAQRKERIGNDDDYTLMVYNYAIRDVSDALDTYAEKNPSVSSTIRALQSELNDWMPLVQEK